MHNSWPSAQAQAHTAAVVDHPSGFLALSRRNQLFAIDGLPGFIAYREQGKHLVAFGGLHAPKTAWDILLDSFLTEAARRRRRVMAVQVRQAQVQLFADRGFTVNQFGTSYGLTLKDYSLGGTKKMKLRNKIKRAEQAGLRVVELGRELPRDASTFAMIYDISTEWLKTKGRQELDFMIGEIGGPEDTQRRIFLVLDRDNHAVAFITYVPVWGEHPGLLHDLTRRRLAAPIGAMELCNAEAIKRFKAEGEAYLHFGFTPFIVDETETPGSSKVVHWIIRQLYTYGRAVYPAESQANYKLKWGTDILEHEYIAARPLAMRAVFDLGGLIRAL
jgi:lysylphosphatidylglycerol synthetase-like protein (DUF2156 family)